MTSARDRIPRALVALAVRWPVVVLLVWAVFFAAATVGGLRLKVETSTDSLLDRGAPEWRFYRQSLDLFGGDELLVVALRGGEPFASDMLQSVDELTGKLEGIEGVRRVDSLASVPLIRSSPDGALSLDSSLAAGIPETAGERAALGEQISLDRIAARSLVSENGTVVAINVLLDGDLGDRFDGVIADIKQVVAGRHALISGVPIFRTEINHRTVAEVGFFSGLTVALIGGLLYFLFGSLQAVVLPLMTGAAGTWAVGGAMGALGVPLTLSTMILPSVMLALGCAHAMHVVSACVGVSGKQELRAALAPVALPVVLSGLTTVIGFLAISSVRIDAIREVSGFGALGVVVGTAAALTLVPAALTKRPLPSSQSRSLIWIGGSLRAWVVRVVSGRRGLVIGLSCLLAVGLGAGLWRVQVETDATRWFLPGSDVRESYEEIRRELSGISPVNVVFQAEHGAHVTRPEFIRRIGELAAHLQAMPEVGKALSLADPLAQLHEGFSATTDGSLPATEALVEQYLLLLESVEQLDDVVTPDRKAANLLLRVDNNGSEDLLRVARAAEEWWRSNGLSDYSARATGIMYEFARAEDEIAWGQLRGLALAVTAVVALLLLILGSLELAAKAMVPNVVPLLAAFGLMGWFSVPLDAGTVLVGNLALGIAIDDTVHLVTAFQKQRQGGMPPVDAFDAALTRVLPAITATTIVIGIGFAVLGFSQFTFTRNLGLLTSLIMVLCYVADVLLLPALLIPRGARLFVSSSD